MTAPSPFETAQMISNNFGKVQQRHNDISAIDEILLRANQSGKQEDVHMAMSQILSRVSPERQQGALAILQNKQQMIQQQSELARKEQERQRSGQAYKTAGLDESAQYLAPAAQTQLLKNKQGMDVYNNLSGNASAAGINAQTETANQLPKSTTENPTAGDNTPAPTTPLPTSEGQPTNPPRKRNITEFSDQELVALSAVPGYAKASEQALKLNQENRKLKLDLHKESEKYDEELLKQQRAAKNQISTIKNIEKAVNSGNITPTALANIFKGFGKIGEKFSDAFMNKDQATLLTSIPQLLEGWKDVFGVRLSDADLKVLQDKLPSIGKSAEANKAVLKILNKYAEMNLLRGQIADRIKSENEGYRPLGFANMVERQFDELTQEVDVINPTNGKVVKIPAYKVPEALKAGGQLAPQEN